MQQELNKLKEVQKGRQTGKMLSGFVKGMTKVKGIDEMFEKHYETSDSDENRQKLVDQAVQAEETKELKEKMTHPKQSAK